MPLQKSQIFDQYREKTWDTVDGSKCEKANAIVQLKFVTLCIYIC